MTYLVPSQCPICQHHLIVTALHCGQCGTGMTGEFSLGLLQKLSAEQLQFVETFILCEGKINRVEQELGMSYPAVRAQLQEVVQALGRSSAVPPMPPQPAAAVPTPPVVEVVPPPPPAITDERRRDILARVSAGEISAKEAADLLRQSQ